MVGDSARSRLVGQFAGVRVDREGVFLSWVHSDVVDGDVPTGADNAEALGIGSGNGWRGALESDGVFPVGRYVEDGL